MALYNFVKLVSKYKTPEVTNCNNTLNSISFAAYIIILNIKELQWRNYKFVLGRDRHFFTYKILNTKCSSTAVSGSCREYTVLSKIL